VEFERPSGQNSAGVDEAGRGPLAGPVVAASVLLPEGYENPLIKDSKKLSPARREELFEIIVREAIGFCIALAEADEIDRINIREATKAAMRRAAQGLCQKLSEEGFEWNPYFLVDGNMAFDSSTRQETIVKGDQKVLVISAASILAKVYRDRLMDDYEKSYPGYGFSVHKGYPTGFHRKRVREIGPCPIHRRTFRGVREYLK